MMKLIAVKVQDEAKPYRISPAKQGAGCTIDISPVADYPHGYGILGRRSAVFGLAVELGFGPWPPALIQKLQESETSLDIWSFDFDDRAGRIRHTIPCLRWSGFGLLWTAVKDANGSFYYVHYEK